MSGRIRSIKPELLEDAVTARLSDTAFRLFVAAILMADDYGRLRAEPGIFVGQVYWADLKSAPDVEPFLQELIPLVRYYEVNGQRYGEIRNWAKHQKVDKPGKPRIPAPLENPPESVARQSRDSREGLAPDLRSPIPITDHDLDADRRPFETGTAAATEARATFEASVATSLSKPYVLPRAPHHTTDLCDALNAHAPKGSLGDALAWLTPTVADWIAASDPRYSSGWAPKSLLSWLNAGRPKKLAEHREPVPIRRAVNDLSGWKP